MADYNKWVVVGNVVKDPEAKETRGGKPFANLRIAFSSGWGENKKSNFCTVSCYGKLGEFVLNYVGKGQKVLVEAVVSTMDVVADGKNTTAFMFTANEVSPISKMNRDEAANAAPAQDDRFPAALYDDDETEIDESNIPF